MLNIWLSWAHWSSILYMIMLICLSNLNFAKKNWIYWSVFIWLLARFNFILNEINGISTKKLSKFRWWRSCRRLLWCWNATPMQVTKRVNNIRRKKQPNQTKPIEYETMRYGFNFFHGQTKQRNRKHRKNFNTINSIRFFEMQNWLVFYADSLKSFLCQTKANC